VSDTESASPSPPGPHKRRKRYSGKNPRKFSEKYKEHDPERYATDVAKVLASGKTPAGSHRPIMVDEILAALALKPGQTVVDCTLGYGGHTREMLALVAPLSAKRRGRLIGLDVDPIEQPKTIARLRAAGWDEDVFTPVRSNFAGLPKVLAELGLEGADAILADLGISSMQLDDPTRGFTFKDDGPLDLRLNPTRSPSAAEWLAKVSEADLAMALRENADEPKGDLIARELVVRRSATPFTRTQQLANALRDILRLPKPSRGSELARAGAHPQSRASSLPQKAAAADETPVRRVFQALRIAVNDEFGALDFFLRNLPFCLKPGGRAAILTFHSGEDRRVKHAFKAGLLDRVYSSASEDVIRAGPEEFRANPRSSSAKLRWAVRV
jgi:16S rRNA (cytosine1402-N4)-methyltransferase